jgi:single-strand DNA-binding protein
MSSVNKAIIVGNAGRDTEVRHLASGMAVANVSIATSSYRKDKQTGERLEETQWHRVTFYDKLAEIAGEYIKKGTKVYVEGTIKYGTYTDKDGVEKNTTDIIANQMTLLSSKEGGGQQSSPRQGGERQERPQQRPQQSQAPRQQQRGGTSFDDMEDDIPFE